MPIKLQKESDIKHLLEKEDVFVMDEKKAERQDIRPVDIAVLNLTPSDDKTWIRLIKSLSNTLLQVNLTLMVPECLRDITSKGGELGYFREDFSAVRKRCFDGLIVTGSNRKIRGYESEDFRKEIHSLFDWADSHVTSAFYLSYGAKEALNYYYGTGNTELTDKEPQIFTQRLTAERIPLIRGFDDEFPAPFSGSCIINGDELRERNDIIVLAESSETGIYLLMNKDGSRIFCPGDPVYSDSTCIVRWRAQSNALFSNWLNYYVYQNTPFELNRIILE